MKSGNGLAEFAEYHPGYMSEEFPTGKKNRRHERRSNGEQRNNRGSEVQHQPRALAAGYADHHGLVRRLLGLGQHAVAVLGFVIVAMSMVGLANAITTNVLERTREIGILRSIGARARDVRRIFTTEGIALGIGGWLLGIPLGYLLTRLLVWLIWEIVEVRIPVVFPPVSILIALVGTIVLALLVLFLPVRRAVRFRPGDAIRYA